MICASWGVIVADYGGGATEMERPRLDLLQDMNRDTGKTTPFASAGIPENLSNPCDRKLIGYNSHH